jgi:hypothetical protein
MDWTVTCRRDGLDNGWVDRDVHPPVSHLYGSWNVSLYSNRCLYR